VVDRNGAEDRVTAAGTVYEAPDDPEEAAAPAGGETADRDESAPETSVARPARPSDAADERSAGDIVDELPEDLDAAGYVGPYMFPDNNRRRIPGYLYLAIATMCVAVWGAVDSPYVNGGFLLAAGLLAVVGVYQIVAGWNLHVDERDALVAATREVGFPVGHASAQLGWRGLLSRPTWRILLYSADAPPEQRGLVLVDGVDGSIVEHFVEPNPEDWSLYDDAGAS
jgi:hypothetical protein